jgi:aldehyde dehydrogenase (NAD+)
MSANAVPSAFREPIRETLRIAGERIARDRVIEVRHPYDGTLAGTVPKATREDVKRALTTDIKSS